MWPPETPASGLAPRWVEHLDRRSAVLAAVSQPAPSPNGRSRTFLESFILGPAII